MPGWLNLQFQRLIIALIGLNKNDQGNFYRHLFICSVPIVFLSITFHWKLLSGVSLMSIVASAFFFFCTTVLCLYVLIFLFVSVVLSTMVFCFSLFPFCLSVSFSPVCVILVFPENGRAFGSSSVPVPLVLSLIFKERAWEAGNSALKINLFVLVVYHCACPWTFHTCTTTRMPSWY